MFKFDFDIDDAEDMDGFEHLGITSPNSKNTMSDLSPEVLEPFSEISLTQLVRAQQSLPPRNIETLTLSFFPFNKTPS